MPMDASALTTQHQKPTVHEHHPAGGPTTWPQDGKAVPVRYFFLHIQKTAGSSLVKHLHTIFNPRAIYPPKDISGGMPGYLAAYLSGEALLALPREELEGYSLYSGHMAFATSELLDLDKPPKTFTILRHPVERTISVLKQKKRHQPEFKDAALEDIYHDRDIFMGQILNHQTKIFSLPPEYGYQSGFAHFEVDHRSLRIAKQNLRKIDVIGLQRDMHTFYIALADQFGWPLPERDYRENVGAKLSVSQAFIERIARDNAIDIAFYQYATKIVRRRTLALRLRRAVRRLMGRGQ